MVNFRESVVEVLWRISGWQHNHLHDGSRSPLFRELIDLCWAEYPTIVGPGHGGGPDVDSARFSLVNLFDSKGIPQSHEEASDFVDAICDAFNQTKAIATYLCPLDMADDLPVFGFGPCEIRTFNQAELTELIQLPRLQRRFPRLQLDVSRLANFNWLVVRDSLPTGKALSHRGGIGAWLDFDMSKDFGAIKPFATTWPRIVERAVFAVTLQDWESYVQYRDLNWRPFQIPWVYTVLGDPFAAPTFPPSPETLSWEPQLMQDSMGEDIEVEVPLRLRTFDGYEPILESLTDERWASIERAETAPLFNPATAHFMVRAFRSEGVDEFLSNISVVEAALGMASDHGFGVPRPQIKGKRQGATFRVNRRLGTLVGESEAGDRYEALFGLRSGFLHGRRLDDISSIDRVEARVLARRVVDRLVDVAAENPNLEREVFLGGLCP
jgi:hypothetical protein